MRNFAHFSVKNFALCKKITFFYAKYRGKMLNAKITAKICEKIYEKINGKHLNLLILQQSEIYIHSQGFTNVLKIKIKHIMYFSRIKTLNEAP